jgi:hypothetical protein
MMRRARDRQSRKLVPLLMLEQGCSHVNPLRAPSRGAEGHFGMQETESGRRSRYVGPLTTHRRVSLGLRLRRARMLRLAP